MDIFSASCVATSIFSFLLGLFVFLKNKKDISNKTWAGVSLSVSIWSLSLFGVVSTKSREIALFWQYILDISATFVPIFFFHFVLVFLKHNKKIEKTYRLQKTILYFIGILLAIFSISSLFKKGVAPMLGFNFWVVPGDFYAIFPIFFSLIISYSLYLLIAAYLKAEGTRRTQIKYVLTAVTIGFGGGMTNFFPQLMQIYPIGNYFVIFYVFFVAYTITYHNFLNLRIAATEILVGMASMALLLEILIAESLSEIIFKSAILVAFVYLGWSLVQSVFREIERRKKLEDLTDRLKSANARLRKLDKAKSEFISIASHQLRTPLTSVKGFISMVLDGSYGKLSKKVKDPLKSVYNSNERLIRLVNDLLNVSKIEAGTVILMPEKIAIEDVVESVIEELKLGAKKKELIMKFKKPKSLPKILLDQDKIRQVILNLVDNAIKYTEQGYVAADISIKSKKEPEEGKTVLVAISDTGDGMTEKETEHLFQSFSRGTAGSKLWTEGAGLGLYVAKKFVEMHGGKIWAESPGKKKGSTFYFELPIR